MRAGGRRSLATHAVTRRGPSFQARPKARGCRPPRQGAAKHWSGRNAPAAHGPARPRHRRCMIRPPQRRNVPPRSPPRPAARRDGLTDTPFFFKSRPLNAWAPSMPIAVCPGNRNARGARKKRDHSQPYLKGGEAKEECPACTRGRKKSLGGQRNQGMRFALAGIGA